MIKISSTFPRMITSTLYNPNDSRLTLITRSLAIFCSDSLPSCKGEIDDKGTHSNGSNRRVLIYKLHTTTHTRTIHTTCGIFVFGVSKEAHMMRCMINRKVVRRVEKHSSLQPSPGSEILLHKPSLRLYGPNRNGVTYWTSSRCLLCIDEIGSHTWRLPVIP